MIPTYLKLSKFTEENKSHQNETSNPVDKEKNISINPGDTVGNCNPSTSSTATNLPDFVKPRSIVWAKMRSYPYWPAQIYDIYEVFRLLCTWSI